MDVITEQFLNQQLRIALTRVGYNSTVGEVGNESIYTNSKIKETFIESIKEQDTFKPIINDVVRLIETDRIVPVHIKTGLLKRIVHFFTKNKKKFAESNYSMAFFESDARKIFVLVENVTNHSYWMKQESLSLVLLHELQHMTSLLFPNSFITLHKKPLIVYFKTFYHLYFNVVLSDEEVYKIVSWLHYKTETTKGRATLTTDMSRDYFNVVWNVLKPHYESVDDLKKVIIRFFSTISLYIGNPDLYAQLVHNKDEKTFKLYTDLRESYKSINILKTDTLCIQELLYPAEVISIESEFNTQPRHFQLISKIK